MEQGMAWWKSIPCPIIPIAYAGGERAGGRCRQKAEAAALLCPLVGMGQAVQVPDAPQGAQHGWKGLGPAQAAESGPLLAPERSPRLSPSSASMLDCD